jgi:ligand-binding sensor domain-containing protein/two-component sensor histidine kinase
MKSFLLLIIWSLFSLQLLFAQQGYTFTRISTDDGIGLASNVVYCTYRDPKGFIWVGTANGLQRFDGSKFVQISSDKRKNILLVSSLTQIIPGNNNTLWLSFPNRQEFGLFNTATYQYQHIPIEATRPLLAKNEFRLWKDHAGEVFITVFNYGILHFDKTRKVFVDDNYFQFPPGWIPNKGHYEDTQTHLYWFPCGNNGLAVYDGLSRKLYTHNYNPKKIKLLDNTDIKPATSEVYIDSKKRHWVFNWPDAHIKRSFDENGNETRDTLGINFSREYSELRYFFETKKGVLWMYGVNVLLNYDNQQHRFYFYDHHFPSSSGIVCENIYHMMEDQDGSIWISTDNGLYFTSPLSGTSNVVNRLFGEQHGDIEITDLIELQSGRRWISTWGNKVITLNNDMTSYDAGIYHTMPNVSPTAWVQYRQVWSLYQHTDGKVWMGCQAGTYMVYDTLTRRTEFLKAKPLRNSTIRYITGDKKGNIWLGSFQGSLAKYDGKQMTVKQELGSMISKILIDKNGLIWVASQNNGLFCISEDGEKIIRHYTADAGNDKLFAKNGADIEQLNDSTIVFGAGAMNFINTRTGKIHWITFEDGLPGNTIERIRADKKGYLWMITLNGLCRYNPITKRITSYGRKDGVTVSNFTRDADFLCSNGTVMFAGSNALLYFNPESFQTQPPRDVVITDFKLFNHFLSVDSLLSLPKVKLNSDLNSFSIYFSELSYLEREKLTYYYKMSGIDQDWIKTDRQNYINYSLLPPGNYNFEVFCEDIDGVRSKNITHLSIYIKPPFWRSYWFINTIAFFIALGIYFIHRLRVNKLLAVEKLRNRVARDLHDDMGSTLSTINILSSMAKSKIQTDPVKTTEYLGKINDNSQRMMDAMDDIVWSIKPSNDSMQKVVARMREFATNVLEAKNIEFNFTIQDPVLYIKMNMEARKDLFLVFKEAVNNAAKYSKATQVTITMDEENNYLRLTIQDNGIGFDTALADNGNGLGNMQKRADAMKGSLKIHSSENKGTTVSLLVPAT